MNRRNLLKSLGTIGFGSLLSMPKAAGAVRSIAADAGKKIRKQSADCWLTPLETEGPYYFNSNLVRQDITPDTTSGTAKTGLPLAMVFTVLDSNCTPVPNVLVDIWHADKDGIYSGYAGQPGGVSTVGQNFLRGIQMTDANGQCTFNTIYPGWYPSRVTHVHFKVRLTSTTYVTSQFAFPDSMNTVVYNTALYSAHGQNSLTNATDSVFQNANPEHEGISVTPNSTTGGYDGAFTVGINAVTDVNDPKEAEPNEFRLEQNYPNPFNPSTTIRYQLPVSSHVKLIVYDVLGNEMITLVDSKQPMGVHEVILDAGKFSSGYYFYKLITEGFVQTKEMLLIK